MVRKSKGYPSPNECLSWHGGLEYMYGVTCITMFAAIKALNMEAACAVCSIVVESILVDGKPANIALQPATTLAEGHLLNTPT